MKKMLFNKMYVKTAILLLFIVINILNAQELIRPSYGILADVNFNNHFANFRKLPDIPNCCKDFESGSGFGYTFGLSYQQPLSDFASNLFDLNDLDGLLILH